MCLGGEKDQPPSEKELQYLANVWADGLQPDVHPRPAEGQRASARESNLVDGDTEGRLELRQRTVQP